MTNPEEIQDDFGPVLTHPEIIEPQQGWLERHKVLVATLGGAACASLGLATRGVVASHRRHKPRFA